MPKKDQEKIKSAIDTDPNEVDVDSSEVRDLIGFMNESIEKPLAAIPDKTLNSPRPETGFEDTKQKAKEYIERKREKVREKSKRYRKNNREKILAERRQVYEDTREERADEENAKQRERYNNMDPDKKAIRLTMKAAREKEKYHSLLDAEKEEKLARNREKDRKRYAKAKEAKQAKNQLVENTPKGQDGVRESINKGTSSAINDALNKKPKNETPSVSIINHVMVRNHVNAR